MIDLKTITERWNKDPQELARFVADPAAYLKALGINLTDKQAEELVKAIKDPKSPKSVADRSIESVGRMINNCGGNITGNKA